MSTKKPSAAAMRVAQAHEPDSVIWQEALAGRIDAEFAPLVEEAERAARHVCYRPIDPDCIAAVPNREAWCLRCRFKDALAKIKHGE